MTCNNIIFCNMNVNISQIKGVNKSILASPVTECICMM